MIVLNGDIIFLANFQISIFGSKIFVLISLHSHIEHYFRATTDFWLKEKAKNHTCVGGKISVVKGVIPGSRQLVKKKKKQAANAKV